MDEWLLIYYSDQKHNLRPWRTSSFVNTSAGADAFFNQIDLPFNDRLQLGECRRLSVTIKGASHKPLLQEQIAIMRNPISGFSFLKGLRHVALSCHCREVLKLWRKRSKLSHMEFVGRSAVYVTAAVIWPTKMK